MQRLDTTPESAGTVDAYLMLGERALPAWVLAALAASLLVSPALVAGGLLVRAPGARGAWWPALVTVCRVALPLVGAVAATRLGAALGLLPDTPWAPRGDDVGTGAILLVLAGVAAGLVAAWRIPHPPRPPASEEAPALLAVTLAVAVGGAVLVLLGSPPTALLLIPALHAWALLPLLAGAGPIARVLVLVVPAAVTFALFLAARGAAPADWLDAIAAREVPGAVAVGLAVALAAAITAIPVVVGLLRGDRRPGGRRSDAGLAALPQRHVRHGLAGRELPVADRDHARARRPRRRGTAGARDRPRACAGVMPSRRIGSARVRVGRRRTASPSAAVPLGLLGPAQQRADERPHQQVQADEHGERVAGQAEHDRAAAAGAGEERLAGLQRDAPEELLHAERGERRAHLVARPDGDAARAHDEVCVERSGERLVRRLGRVARRRRAGRRPRSRTPSSVAAMRKEFDSWIWPRRSSPPGRHELVAGRQHHARAAGG